MPSNTRLLDLPLELLRDILSYLPGSSLAPLRLVCRMFGSSLQPQIFEQISLSMAPRGHWEDSYLNLLARLDSSAKGGLPARVYTRLLVIGIEVSGESIFDPAQANELERAVVGFIASLDSLRRVRLVASTGLNPPVAISILNAIGSLPHLTDLQLLQNFTAKDDITSLTPFKDLQKLSIISGHDFNALTPWLEATIANSPSLAHLSINQHEWMEYETPLREVAPLPSPTSFFASRPPLAHLTLSGKWPIPNPPTFLLPLLPTLTSLSVNSLPRSDPNWTYLTRHAPKIGLKRVTALSPTPAFLEFLASFSGITSLHLSEQRYRDDNADILSRIFFESVMPAHAATLESLWVDCEYYYSKTVDDGKGGTIERATKWTFDCARAEEVFPGCDKLRHLAIGLQEEHNMSLSSFLYTISSLLPSLHSLAVVHSSPEWFKTSWCGNPIINYEQNRKDYLRMFGVHPPPGMHYPRWVRIQYRCFELVDGVYVEAGPSVHAVDGRMMYDEFGGLGVSKQVRFTGVGSWTVLEEAGRWPVEEAHI